MYVLYVDNCFVSGCSYMTALQVIIHKMTVYQMIAVYVTGYSYMTVFYMTVIWMTEV
jgi:hypothetical protein